MNRPILERVLDALIDAGIEDLHLVVGYRRDRVQEYFGSDHRGHPLTYHVQEKQLGSGHALLQVQDAIDSDFLVANGDEVVDTDVVRAVIDGHTAKDTGTLAIAESEAVPLYGAVRLDGSTVTELVEKPDENEGPYRLVNVGVYAFGPSIFSTIEETDREAGEIGLTDAVAHLVGRGGHVRGVRTDGMRSEATYPWDLTELANRLLEEGRVDEPAVEPGVFVAESASVDDDALLCAPVVISPDAAIEPGAVVGPNTAVGRNATVETAAVVRRSVIDIDARVGANATLVDTIVGQEATVGDGATVPGGPAEVRIGDRIYQDKRLGCALADRARLGGGATVSPGVLIGPGAVIGPGVRVTQHVPENAEIRG